MPGKISNKKKRLINDSECKLALQKQKPKKVIISFFDNSDKKEIAILL